MPEEVESGKSLWYWLMFSIGLAMGAIVMSAVHSLGG